MYRTINYAKCHRCEGANDRGSQRTCSSCHRTIQTEHREKKKREAIELLQKVQELEGALAVALARAVAAESILASLRVSRHTSREIERAA